MNKLSRLYLKSFFIISIRVCNIDVLIELDFELDYVIPNLLNREIIYFQGLLILAPF